MTYDAIHRFGPLAPLEIATDQMHIMSVTSQAPKDLEDPNIPRIVFSIESEDLHVAGPAFLEGGLLRTTSTAIMPMEIESPAANHQYTS